MKYLILISIISLLNIKTTTAQPQVDADALLSMISINEQVIRTLQGSSCDIFDGRIVAMRITVLFPKLENTGDYSDVDPIAEPYELPSYRGEIQFGQPIEETFTILPVEVTPLPGNEYRIRYIPQSLYGGNIFLYHRGVDPLRLPHTPKPNDVREAIIAFEDDGSVIWNPWIRIFHYRDHSPQSVDIRPIANINWSYDENIYEQRTIELLGDDRRYTDGEGREWILPIDYAGSTSNNCVLKRFVSSVQYDNEGP